MYPDPDSLKYLKKKMAPRFYKKIELNSDFKFNLQVWGKNPLTICWRCAKCNIIRF